MSRLQLALNVSDIESAVAFYSKLFNAEPHKRRPGYANFAIDNPPLKLVLFEGGTPATINHLGVEVEDSSIVKNHSSRLAEAGLQTRIEERTVCCYAEQEKVWVSDPDGAPWEIYTILDDNPVTVSIDSNPDICPPTADCPCC